MDISVNIQHVLYHLMDKVATALLDRGAIIFGGYVRDKILHNHAAKIFYDTHAETDHREYDDASFDPDTIDRLVVPKDIDVFAYGTLDDVTNEIREVAHELHLDISDRGEAKMYLDADDVKRCMFRLSTYSYVGMPTIGFNVDFLYSMNKSIVPPFFRCDMTCNALLLKNTGLFLSHHFDVKYSTDIVSMEFYKADIMRDIVAKTTKSLDVHILPGDDPMEKKYRHVREVLSYRLLKMISRGWKVSNVEYNCVKDTSDDCIICQSHAEKDAVTGLLPVECKYCKAVMHASCFLAYVKGEFHDRITPRCPNACEKRDGWKVI